MTATERERTIKERARNALKRAHDELNTIKGQVEEQGDPHSRTRANVLEACEAVMTVIANELLHLP